MILTICDEQDERKERIRQALAELCSREQLELTEQKISGMSLFLQNDRENPPTEETVQALFAKLSREEISVTYPFVEGKTTLSVADILYVESNRHKNWFYTADAAYSIYRKLGEIEEELREYGFIRIHQSFLVNMRYIAKINSYTLTLTSGEVFSVPKVRYSQVKRSFLKFKGVDLE